MPKETSFFASTIGKKVVMAVTGIMLVGFVLGHMAGNLQLYMHPHEAGGEHPLDAYGRFLKTMLHGGGIWIARGGLLAATAAHVWAAVGLTKLNAEARPVGYRAQQNQASTLASRWMRISGFVLLAFIAFHLGHFTFGKFTPFEEGKVFANVVAGFSVPWVSGFYILAMLALASHLSHGIWSLMQSMGWNHPAYNDLRKKIAQATTAVVIIANISFPVAVLAGWVK